MKPRERDPEVREDPLEPTLDVETAPDLAPPGPSEAPPSRYWHAQGLADELHHAFEDAKARGDAAGLRNTFYVLARYYGRTLAILRSALADGKEDLFAAALRNLVALHHPLHHMHDLAPTRVPLALTLDRHRRELLVEDLLAEALQEAGGPVSLADLTLRVNERHLLSQVSEAAVAAHLAGLAARGHVRAAAGGWARTHRPYGAVNLDLAALEALLGPELYPRFGAAGYHGLADVEDRPAAFRAFLCDLTGFGAATAERFLVAARELLAPPTVAPDLGARVHADLLGGLVPRPYQRDAFAIFRGYGYRGQVIEAPTGSGKTLVGMMCLQDWLGGMAPGESVLVLVPTVNYQQQWVGELCHRPTGLGLSPDGVFAGTPGGLGAHVAATGAAPTVVVMTYAALAQAGSGAGKGGFDRRSIERFLQAHRVQYAILDECHKVVDDLGSVSADVTRLLTDWLRDGSVRGLVGFSGTAAAYRQRFADVGLELVHTVAAADLIAYGFVAPFAELGLPFAHSDREQLVRSLLDDLKALLSRFTRALGSAPLRRWFAALPLEERVGLGRDLLGMYAGRPDRDALVTARLEGWEAGGALTLSELGLVTILQVARGWSDAALAQEAGLGEDAFAALLAEAEELRSALRDALHLPDLRRRLDVTAFATTLPADALRALAAEHPAAAHEAGRDLLATTLVGLYEGLKPFYQRAGEGRVETVRAVIAAETDARPVSGVIVFDEGRRLAWERGRAVPGYRGVAGLFAHLLGHRGLTPMAVLSGELYLPWREHQPPAEQIAAFVRREILLGELAAELAALWTRGLGLAEAEEAELGRVAVEALAAYAAELDDLAAPRPAQIDRLVFRRLRRHARALGAPHGPRLEARLGRTNPHLARWIETFFHYALIAAGFRRARVAELEQADGTVHRFSVIPMPQGERRQLVYDLTARVVDAEDLLIDVVIVSPWARTGWNVVRPNLLIDATATRDVTAWQQLRGRAMGARESWDQRCYQLVMALLGERAPSAAAAEDLAPDAEEALERLHGEAAQRGALGPDARELLLAALAGAPDAERLAARVRKGRLTALSRADRAALVTALMLARNKVTHVYELLKASGSSPQVHRDPGSGAWVRAPSVAAKHDREHAVSPVTGRYGPGADHAPLVLAGDPRRVVPSLLRRELGSLLAGADRRIVEGWVALLLAEGHPGPGAG